MASAIGDILIKDVAVGSSAAAAIALGNTAVWQKEAPAPANPWLCFTATEADSSVTLTKVGSPNSVSLETSNDGVTWSNYSINVAIPLAAVGDKIYIRSRSQNNFSKSDSAYYQFVGTGKFAASGNIQSLLKADCSRTDVPSNCYTLLFSGCTSLVDAHDLQLPATTLNSQCYIYMFNGCTSLSSGPAELPATTAANNGYMLMFANCTSLTNSPAIRLTNINVSYSCYQMFNGCSSLSSVEVAFTYWGDSWKSSTANWLSSTAATGTFKCPSALGTDSTIARGASNCPTGWTVVNTDA